MATKLERGGVDFSRRATKFFLRLALPQHELGDLLAALPTVTVHDRLGHYAGRTVHLQKQDMHYCMSKKSLSSLYGK